jgi:hypothetical protein
VRAALRCRDRVAVGVHESVAAMPGDGPLDRPVATGPLALAGKDVGSDLLFAAEARFQIVLQSAGEVEHGLGRCLVLLAEQFRRALPADFDTAEQIGFGTRHLVEARRLELRGLAENLGVRVEARPGTAPVLHFAKILQPGDRLAARKALAVELAIAGDLDLEIVGKRVHDRDADAVQAARRFVDL